MLTEKEHEAMGLTADLCHLFGDILSKNEASRSNDLSDAILHIHALQRMLMAQSAARVYPMRYRLLGEVLGEMDTDIKDN